MGELKENEKLTKEKFLSLVMNELEENQNLSIKQKEKIGESLSNNYVQNLVFNLVNNKLNKQGDFNISAKDVVEVEITKNSTPVDIATPVVKKVLHKVIK